MKRFFFWAIGLGIVGTGSVFIWSHLNPQRFVNIVKVSVTTTNRKGSDEEIKKGQRVFVSTLTETREDQDEILSQEYDPHTKTSVFEIITTRHFIEGQRISEGDYRAKIISTRSELRR